MAAKKILLVIDVQNDFCEGGALVVKNADDVVPVINELIAKGNYDIVIATKDWHPPDHVSFQPEQIGKAHCVQGTKGAELHPALNHAAITYVQHKGMERDVDCNSAFRDNDGRNLTGLSDYIRTQAGEDAEIHICGLVTNRCVKLSALDARELLPNTKIAFIEDASRGTRIESIIKAKKEMQEAGIEITHSRAVLPDSPAPVGLPGR